MNQNIHQKGETENRCIFSELLLCGENKFYKEFENRFYGKYENCRTRARITSIYISNQILHGNKSKKNAHLPM